MKIKIVIIDDDQPLVDEMSKFLTLKNYEVKTAHSLKEAEKQLETFHPDISLLDLKLPDGSGLDFLQTIKQKAPETSVLMLSGYGNIDIAVEAIKQGAENFLTKPVDPDYLLLTVEKLIEVKLNHDRLLIQDQEIAERRQMVIGKSQKMDKVIQTCQTAAQRDIIVLITGETGTGKHLLAHFIHENGSRANFPFVYVNCATLTETLLESDLFGHEKGAFTGAIKQKKGRVELANRGTLFLDEIGELPLKLQSKLLHFIEYGELQRVGSTTTLYANVRLICATNRNLQEEVAKGTFREDLYYRINVIQVNIPPLRERPEDISLLCRHFLEKYKIELGKSKCQINEKTLKNLVNYPWPGNIRELQNAIERAVVLSKTDMLSDQDFPSLYSVSPVKPSTLFDPHPLQEAINQFKKEYIQQILEQNGGNQTKTAQILNIQRTYLNRLIKELQIE
jgi:DNA-binding NtrC family response regulator